MRVAVVWLALAFGITAFLFRTAGPLQVLELPLCAVLLALAMGAGVSSSAAVAALRAGAVRVHAEGPPWGIWRHGWPAIVAAVVVGAFPALLTLWWFPNSPGDEPLGENPPGWRLTLWLAAPLAVVVARLLVRAPRDASPIQRTRWRWLVVEGALPSAVIAASVGVVIGLISFNNIHPVAPGALARTLAGTSIAYLLLGLAGFAKAFQETKQGVVVVDGGPGRALPGPAPVGLALAALLTLAGPWFLPALPGADLPLIKGVFGFVVGGGLSLLGAWSGHRRALVGDG